MAGSVIHSFPATRAFDWLAEGWRIFRLAPRQWLLAALASAAIIVLLSVVPRVGELLGNLAALLLLGGLMQMARDLDEGITPPLSRMFVAVREQLVPVVLTALVIGLVVSIAIFAVVVLAGGSAWLGGLASGKWTGMARNSLAGLAIVMGVIAIALGSTMFWFSPGLVVLRGMKPVESVRQSARGFARNWGASLLFAAMFFGLGIAATIPFGLGWLLLMPVMAAASYTAVKDVFGLPER